MPDATGTAKLVDAGRVFDGRGVTAAIPRGEVERAVRSETNPELFLDIGRIGTDEAQTLRVAWELEDLEELLRTSEGDEIGLEFDPAELEQALEADVEAHGLRERALVLTVAVATAGAFAGQAAAKPSDPGGGLPAAPAAHATAPQSEGRTTEQIWSSAPASMKKEFYAETSQPSSGGGGIDIDSPSPSTAAGIAGGVALLITGAGFAVRGQRRTPKSA
jgi:hypothetical protein